MKDAPHKTGSDEFSFAQQGGVLDCYLEPHTPGHRLIACAGSIATWAEEGLDPI